MAKIRILLVDDSAFMRLLLTDILSEDSALEVVGSAINGKEAIEKVHELDPDVVLLDMNMGEYDGTYAVKGIMAEKPKPILILSAVGNTNLEPIFDALRLGAVDYMNKPVKGGSKMRGMEAELRKKIKTIGGIKPKVIRSTRKKRIDPPSHNFKSTGQFEVVVIGASTGGPTAIEEIITVLPENLTVPVLIVQHMPANFISPFVERLNDISPLEIHVARQGVEPFPGEILVAPGDGNMIVERKKTGKVVIGFSDAVYREYNNPSINALMLSVAKVYGEKAMGVILTGMGKDGVDGLLSIRKAGGMTIGQDKSSSVIYGMPRVAFEKGAVENVMGIKEIGGFIINNL